MIFAKYDVFLSLPFVHVSKMPKDNIILYEIASNVHERMSNSPHENCGYTIDNKCTRSIVLACCELAVKINNNGMIFLALHSIIFFI